ncbi:MAG: tRNA uridine-5-carboxymethylaminomethyl(34) synthesis GTPase MnmE [Bacillota bacterium]
MTQDTIAAISTPSGEGGVGIIRISGENAFNIGKKIFRPSKPGEWLSESYKMHYGHIVDSSSGRVIDEVLLSVMKAPHTYTREDVLEINCHGGMVPLKETLRLVLSLGARLAEPGEFTKRAFINGRIDLSQAESVIDVIRSKTETSLRVAMSQLGGGLSKKIKSLQDSILGILAEIEASIDFPEDDIEERAVQEILKSAQKIVRQLDELISAADRGKIYRDGLKTVIIGRPNVGKSSLLNALLGRERAIVTNIPGTTRDVIEEMVNIRGIPLILADTAGLRETEDLVEKIGVEKTREFLAGAELVLFVVDASEGITRGDREILNNVDREKTLLIINKKDLAEKAVIGDEWNLNRVEISALLGEGLERLEKKIEEIATGGKTGLSDSIMVSNLRHEEVLNRARKHMEDFVASLKGGVPADLLSIDIRNSWEALGEITGSTVTEDLLDRIFNDFCIGK